MKRTLSLVLLVLTVAAFTGCASRHPADQTLIAEFQTHKTQFQQLLEMFQADKKLGRVGYNSTWPENPGETGVSPERLLAYRKIRHIEDNWYLYYELED
jgi:hypothetical protein